MIKSPIIANLLSDIRFWIVLMVFVRLYGISLPPLEVEHNWRQTTVTMAARNFLEVDNNILYPRIDIAGEKTGITGMEFPLLNYLIYLCSLLFGYEHWYGRLINLVVSSFGIWSFFRIVKRYFSRQVAFNAAFVLLFSLWLSYSRKIMPDTFSISLVLFGIQASLAFLSSPTWWRWLLVVLFFGLGTLSKLPSGFLLGVLPLLYFDKNLSRKHVTLLGIGAALSLLPAMWWYFTWVPHLVEEYGFHHFFMGKTWSKGIHELQENLPSTFKKFYEIAIKYVGFVLFLTGLVFMVAKRNKLLIAIFATLTILFAVVVIKSGVNFPKHSYYVLGFIPVMALLAGYGMEEVRLHLANARTKFKSVVPVLLFMLALEGFLNQQHDVRISTENAALVDLEMVMDQCSESSDLIAINSGRYPTPMYFSHRKGWVVSNDELQDPQVFSAMKANGLAYVVILRNAFERDLNLQLERVYKDENFVVYRVQ